MKDQQHSKYLYALNQDIREGGADGRSRAQSKHVIKRRAISNTVNLLPRNEVDRFAPPSCGANGLIDSAVLDARIKGASEIGEQLKATRVEALRLEDEVLEHQVMLQNGAFERLAGSCKCPRASS